MSRILITLFMAWLLPASTAGANQPLRASLHVSQTAAGFVPARRTETTEPGQTMLMIETIGGFGGAEGRYRSLILKPQLIHAFSPAFSVGLSTFLTHLHTRDLQYVDDFDRTQFDGVAGEVIWTFLRHEPSSITANLSVEGRWARVGWFGGELIDLFSANFKLTANATLVPDRLFASVSVNVAPGTSRAADAFAPWAHFVSSGASATLTWQGIEITRGLFIGAEVNVSSLFIGPAFNRRLGTAFFAGPNLTYAFNQKTSLNMAWTPQILGDAMEGSGRLDLVNFDRQQFNAKLHVNF